MDERRRAGFDGQRTARSLVSVRAELRLGDANGEYELRRVTTVNSGELHCESEGGTRRERASSGREMERAQRPIYRGARGRGEGAGVGRGDRDFNRPLMA
jgi:hypothetical protein